MLWMTTVESTLKSHHMLADLTVKLADFSACLLLYSVHALCQKNLRASPHSKNKQSYPDVYNK